MFDPDLIFDIGCNEGSDTRYYLSKEFRVLAVDADAALVRALQEAHPWWRSRGMLMTKAVGVGAASGTFPFYRNTFSEWSSFSQNSKAVTRLSHQVEMVDVVTLAQLFQEFGVPYYLKLDVEEWESEIIQSMAASSGLPAYVSFELNPGWDAALSHLAALGYTAFQLVRQGQRHLDAPPNPTREKKFMNDVKFSNRHSGNFGRDLRADSWFGLDDIFPLARAEDIASRERDRLGLEKGWFDLHARHKDAPS